MRQSPSFTNHTTGDDDGGPPAKVTAEVEFNDMNTDDTTSTMTSATTATVQIVAAKPRAAEDRCCPCCRQSIPEQHRLNCQPVLIVSHHDGYLEAFSEKHVNVRLETMPFAGLNAESESMAEEYLEFNLPRPHRNVFCSGLRTTLGQPSSANPSDIAAREYDLRLLRGIQRATA